MRHPTQQPKRTPCFGRLLSSPEKTGKRAELLSAVVQPLYFDKSQVIQSIDGAQGLFKQFFTYRFYTTSILLLMNIADARFLTAGGIE
jgi:hypothetical protein